MDLAGTSCGSKYAIWKASVNKLKNTYSNEYNQYYNSIRDYESNWEREMDALKMLQNAHINEYDQYYDIFYKKCLEARIPQKNIEECYINHSGNRQCNTRIVYDYDNAPLSPLEGGMLKRHKIHIGPYGGRYYIRNGKKKYI